MLLRVRSANPSAFDEIAAWRADMKLGAPGTKVNGKEYVLSRLDVDGHSPVYGINWDMGHPRPPGVTFQFLKHAEGDAFSQAARAGILRGGKATLYVDKVPCDWCWKSFANFSKYHGVEELTVVTPQGIFGRYNPSLGQFVKEQYNMVTTAIVQHWAGLNHAEEQIPIADTSELEAAVRRLVDAESATLTLEAADKTLIIGASSGLYCATAILGFDDILDMVGDAAQSGTISFVQGGQEVDLPKHQVLTVEQAIAAAKEFFETGSVNVERHWQKQ